MRTAKELYPELDKAELEYFYGPYDYQPIIDAIGNVLIQVDDNDYQGDSRILYEIDGKYGFLIFGWGSCSGCDALQACNTMGDIQQLIDSMVCDVKWFDSLQELQQYFRDKDWELEWSYHQEETQEFINKVLDYNAETVG